ncbi:hypothetical protein [Joostella sp.]|uniref:hypothetical protein n=1 Tax=Joostella sp. TaxID=2231138 RepID=UPI003A90A31C
MSTPIKRRNFITLSVLSSIGLSLPLTGFFNSCKDYSEHSQEFKKLTSDLLRVWCDGMIKVQINNPNDLKEHGALGCPSCAHIHGRCMDAVYPFLYMADITGDKKYLKAASLVMIWAENNVSQDDGSWTVISNPKSWKGITVFGAIALAEALHYHGHVLEDKTRISWTNRLEKAGQYIYNTFSIDFTNINYGGTAIYGLDLIGEVLDNKSFKAKSKKMADKVKSYFTKKEHLLFGECKPEVGKLSAKGLHGVDLGYNVEETLNSLVMYALKNNDEELKQLITKSLHSHLDFMLPDGGWDNSWGNRMYKWSYWGSRTCDGSQPAYAMMAHISPAFGTAAVMNTELLKQCTHNGLIHGGPHYVSAGILPCVHHTFAHAKPLATLLDHWKYLPEINKKTPLPRVLADGIKHFEDLDVSLFARGDWRGTVSAYDAEYHYKYDYRQATGSSLGMLYHTKVGLLCAASMAIYHLVEKNNQQPQPGKDIALTPRIETYKDNKWYTNLFDLTSCIKSKDQNDIIELLSEVELKNEAREVVLETASKFHLKYSCSKEVMKIQITTDEEIKKPTAFVLPIASPKGEHVEFISESEVSIQKEKGLVTIKANAPIKLKAIHGDRLFNMVPGIQTVPFEVFFEEQSKKLVMTISVS